MKAFKDFVKKIGIVLMLFMGFIMFLGFFSGNTGMGVIGTSIIGGWFLHRQWKEARKYNERYEPKRVYGFQKKVETNNCNGSWCDGFCNCSWCDGDWWWNPADIRNMRNKDE